MPPSFTNPIEFDEQRIKTKVIVETSFSKEIRIAMLAGQQMKEHKTPYPIIIDVLEGEIDLGVNGQTHCMKSNDIISLEGNIPHDLTAKQDTVIRLSLSKHDKVERVVQVIEAT